MKKLIVSALLIASQYLFASTSFAQEGKMPPEERADKMTEKMKTALSLTDEQKMKAKEINTKTVQSLREIKDKYKALMQADLKKIEDESDSQYKLLLSPDQYTKYVQLKDERKDKMKEKIGKRRDK